MQSLLAVSRPPLSARVFAGLGILVTALLLGGCGYQFTRYREPGAQAPRLFLRTLENDTAEPRVELIFTEALRREVLRRGALRLVTDEAAADYRVSGSVAHLQTRGRSFSSTVLALEYTLEMEIDLRIRDRDGAAIQLDQRSLSTSEVFLASADVEAGRKNRRETLMRVSEVLAGRIVDALDQVAFP